MHFLLLFVLTLSSSSLAFNPIDSLSIASKKAHNFALRHSYGLAKDLRIAFGGPIAQRDSVSSDNSAQKVVCVKPDTLANPLSNANNTSPKKVAGSTSTSSASAGLPSSTSLYKLQASYMGESFFNGWDFWDTADPTGGTVQYVNQGTAQSNNLTSINSAGHAIMRVDTTPVVQNARMSVRITTEKTFTHGLFVLDVYHVPTGCGTWPAWWMNGPNWPAGGEIDIVEGVNDLANNQASIHTNPGCSVPSADSSVLNMTGTLVGGTNCAAAQTQDSGCGVQATQTNTYGVGLNDNGGGVYAMLWTSTDIKVWFFPRSSIPSDISSGSPDPTNPAWGVPMAHWPGSSQCSLDQYFYTNSVIFDTTLCGQWAGGVWAEAGPVGQEQSCQARVQVNTCEEFVLNNGASFDQAYWEVGSMAVYQTTPQS